MSRLAQSKKARENPPKDDSKKKDKRNLASKLFDTVNLIDSGRSFSTAEPSKEQKKKSGASQGIDIGGLMFENTIKLGNNAIDAGRESVELGRALTGALTGNEEAEQAAINRAETGNWSDEGRGILGKGGIITNKEAGEPISPGRLTKKIIGGGLGVAGEILPAGKGVQAGKVAAKEAAEQGGKQAGRIVMAKTAARAGAEGAALGAAGGAGSASLDDNASIKDIAVSALTGAGFGGVLGSGSAYIPAAATSVRGLDERGSVRNPLYKSRISDELQPSIDRGRLSSNVKTEKIDNLQAGADTGLVNDLDRTTVDDYKVRLQRGEELDPIIVQRGDDGRISVQDGAHRLEAARELGITDIPTIRQKTNVVMAEKVAPPTAATLEAPAGMRVIDDFNREANFRSPGDETVAPKQIGETKVQKGAQYIIDDLDKLQKETGIEVQPLNRRVAGALTGEVRRSGWQEFKDKMGRNFQDTLTYSARTVGKPGVDLVYDMLQGNKFKRDALDALRPAMDKINKLNKSISGKSLTSRRDVGARIGAALDDRANAQQYLRTDKERELFDNYVQVFDYVKQLREKGGLETVENYRPWVNMKEASEPPTWLADSVTTKKVQTESRFSKTRTSTEAGDDVETNLADMIYGYVNSQLNEMAYDAPVKKFKGNFDSINAGNRANAAELNDGVTYLNELVQQAVNPQRKDPATRLISKLTSNVYGAVLPFNPRLAIQNKTQKFAANSRVSKGARRLAGKMDAADLKELEKGLIFGDNTVYGQIEDVNPTPTGRKPLREKVEKIDYYQKSEKNNVLTSFNKGAAQAIIDSPQYKALVKSGVKKKDAAKQALQDPAVKEAAIRRGNIVVNDTQFGASALARPAALRSEGSVFGIPIKTFTMFTRFPIGMSQHVLETLNGKSTRALEALKNGDPRAVSISEMRTNYHALLDSMEDAHKAVKSGRYTGIPEDVLSEQIKTVKKNLKVIDKQAKKASQIRGGKTLRNFTKMWVAAAAIQVIFDTGIQSFEDDPVGTTQEALSKTNPTATSFIAGQNSKLGGIGSAALPVDKYGGVNERAVANYIPGVGLAVNRARDIKKLYNSLTGAEEE